MPTVSLHILVFSEKYKKAALAEKVDLIMLNSR